MTLDTPKLDSEATRAYVIEYAALVTDEGVTVLDDAYEHASARRDAVIDVLASNHDEVDQDEIDDILASFGGANPDVALALVTERFVNRGGQIDVTLGERRRDVGPITLWTAFTEYGDGTTAIEHYGTREDRLAALRQRALHLTDEHSSEWFDRADEETCRRVLDGALARTHGRVLLLEATRHRTDEAWGS